MNGGISNMTKWILTEFEMKRSEWIKDICLLIKESENLTELVNELRDLEQDPELTIEEVNTVLDQKPDFDYDGITKFIVEKFKEKAEFREQYGTLYIHPSDCAETDEEMRKLYPIEI